ncbi:cholesterol esterase [Coemansia sp. RSA 1853]|nr:cholesterol esterase [Coemansia sp. RSA 1853]
MLYIPFFSRLSLSEYQGMLVAALFFIVEKLLRVLLLLVPAGLVMDYLPDWVFSQFKVPHIFGADREAESRLLDDFNSFAEIMEFWSYPHEDHLVETRDGFVLGIHRITGKRRMASGAVSQTNSETNVSVAGHGRGSRPVVLFWHGFMLSSECFVCHPDWVNILPFRLAEAGYDVWLGNSRGNKYSYKHMKYVPGDQRFWNFSIDEIANIDVPTTVDHILEETGAQSLTYIGFSQGTTQMFMALSRNRGLNSKVDHFIALAPASTPRGFHNNIVDYFTKATPQMLYLLFGRRRAMSLVYFWINILPRDLYVAALDFCVHLLFGWTMRNMSQETKCIAYWHLYSYTSVKAIVHWMQIIRRGELQMYDEDPPAYQLLWASATSPRSRHISDDAALSTALRDGRKPNSQSTRSGRGFHKHSRPPSLPPSARSARIREYSAGALAHWNNPYPVHKITTRVSLFHGGSDSLSSVDVLLKDLNGAPVESTCINHYEHMDFLWADTVGGLVYSKVLSIERQELFGDSTTQNKDASTAEADSQDVELFEEIMKSRMGMDIDDATPDNTAEASDNNVDEASAAPVFRMFAGAKAVKVETEIAEIVYIAPERPEVEMEESDSEEHRQALASAAIDAQTVKAMAQIPTPALLFPKRVIHIKAEPAVAAQNKDTTKKQSKHKQQRRGKRSETTVPYVRVLSPYSGGMLKGEMLADVIRREEANKLRAAKLTAQRGRGGFRGRGRGRGSVSAM